MRQAVVLIHGIGEQKPMSTLRGFVESVLRESDESPAPVYSKPDRMSKSLELRRLVAEKSRRRPMTDFFEYYWAHHMDGTKLRHLWPWLRGLLLRWPWSVPPKLRVLWALSWLLAGGACALYVAGYFQPEDKHKFSVSSLILGGVFLVVQGFAINYLGDAARYLSPLPSNIAVRQKIRAEGIELLERLHRSGHYDRIVLVGHSLGSVIGYDVLTHLWLNYNTAHGTLDRPQHRSLELVEKLGQGLTENSPASDLSAFRDAQRDLWSEQRKNGFPWLVTDFITLGSPLAHAAILLAKDSAELTTRTSQREYPTCPPVLDANQYSFTKRYDFKGSPRSVRILHHAAQFAPTRWSNIYVPIRLGLVGDFVGGPLRSLFGPGILDVELNDGLLRFLPMVSHTRYWDGSAVPKKPGRITALGALCKALSLNSTRWLAKRTDRGPIPPEAPPDERSSEVREK